MDSNKYCNFCNTASGKYVCPRCNMLYCSTSCYQSESHLECSESFYKECVMQEIGCNDANLQDQRKVLEMLKRVHEQEPQELDSDDDPDERSESSDVPDLIERLKDIDLDDADSVWEKLTTSERQEFEDLLKSGDVSKLLPAWKPWWARMPKKLVEELVSSSNTDVEIPEISLPVVSKQIPKLSEITSRPPSELIKWNIINVIGAFCYLARYYNGEYLDYPEEAAGLMEALAGVLKKKANCSSAEIALKYVIQEIQNCTWLEATPETILTMKTDVRDVLHGPEDCPTTLFVLCVLNEIHKLFSKAKEVIIKGKKKNDSNFSKRFGEHPSAPAIAVTKENVGQYLKKIEYFLSWTIEYGLSLCECELAL